MKKYSSNMKGAGGFTLIELIVVIVILGILAATALPKMSGLGTDARVASMQAVAGSLLGAAQMAHGQSSAERLGAQSSITLEDGTPVTMMAYYPDSVGIGASLESSNNPIASAVTSAGTTATIVAGLVTVAGTAPTVEFYPDATRVGCKVVYTGGKQTTTGFVGATVDSTAIAAANCG